MLRENFNETNMTYIKIEHLPKDFVVEYVEDEWEPCHDCGAPLNLKYAFQI